MKPQLPSVALPYSSPFKKLPILTKHRPIGILRAAESRSLIKLILFCFEKINIEMITPISPPWKERPPSQI